MPENNVRKGRFRMMDSQMLAEKIQACWLGKALGGGLGAPYEGVPYKLEL